MKIYFFYSFITEKSIFIYNYEGLFFVKLSERYVVIDKNDCLKMKVCFISVFLTGSDRIPISGMKSLKVTILNQIREIIVLLHDSAIF